MIPQIVDCVLVIGGTRPHNVGNYDKIGEKSKSGGVW